MSRTAGQAHWNEPRAILLRLGRLHVNTALGSVNTVLRSQRVNVNTGVRASCSITELYAGDDIGELAKAA